MNKLKFSVNGEGGKSYHWHIGTMTKKYHERVKDQRQQQ